MKVLLNAMQAGNRSGTGTYTTELVRWLPSVAGDLDLIVSWPDDVPHPRGDGYRHEAFLERPSKGELNRMLYGQFQLNHDRRTTGASLLHHMANVGNMMEQGRTVVTVHDLSFIKEPSWYRLSRSAFLRWAVPRGVRKAERVLAVSQATANDVHEVLGVPEDRIDAIPSGVEDYFKPASDADMTRVREAYTLPKDFLLYLGTIEPRKNIERIVRAFTAVAGDLDLDLVLVGRDGWKVDGIYQAVKESPFRDRIHFPGFVAHEDKAAVLSCAHAFVWPSLFEGFGHPILESMACGVPVLTSDASSMPETAGGAAVLVDPYDVEAIADGMRRIVCDGTLRTALVDRGHARALACSWQQSAAGTIAAYRRALDL
jgi:glycosyltransferase involved in cell wall biosynthesis